MSTYTDLHNRIKENVTILRKPGSKDDGMSPQKVVLINPENQFYGTFNGAMNIKGGTLSNLNLVGGTIDGTALKNATFLDGDTLVPIGEIAAAVSDHEQRLTQAEAGIKAISSAYDSLSAGLSGAIDVLSVGINEKIDAAVDGIEKRISGAVDGIEDLSSDVLGLSGALSDIVLNGVVYKGTLLAYRDEYAKPRNLFNDDPACCILEGLQQPLKNGWMWRVHLDSKNVGGYVTVNDPVLHKSMQLGEGDYIIIKSHNPSEHEVVPDDTMRLDDFDVINAQDGDDAKLSVILKLSSEVKDISAYFEKKTNDISASLCAEMSGLSSGIADVVSSEITAQMDQRYVKKAGDSISALAVDTDLAVGRSITLNGPLTVSADDTSLVVSDDEVSLKTRSQIELQTAEGIGVTASGKVAVETRGPVVLSGSNLSAVLKNQIHLCNERGLDDLYVNGKSVQSSLIELSSAFDDLKFDKVLGEQVSSQVTAIQGYVDELSGAYGSEGIVKYLSNEISSLRSDEKFEMQLNKVDVLGPEAADGRYASIGHFLSAMLEPTVSDVRNNTGYVVEFASDVPLSTRISISDGLGTTLGHGDTIYIHVLSSIESAPIRVPFADLVPYNRNDQAGNTFIIQAGVSRYEFEEQVKNLSGEISARVAADAYISAQIEQLSTELSTELSNEIEARISGDNALFNDYVERIGNLSTALSNETDKLSTALSNEIGDLSIALSNEITALSTALSNNIDSICADLSVAISSKIWIEDRISGTISGHSDLSVVKMSRDSYEELAVGSLCSNVLYVVESYYINAYGEKIANATMTDDPTESEAATQHYVDDKLTHKPDISSIDIEYSGNERKIHLSAGGQTKSIDCNDFIKDGMLSSAQLCGTTLILTFNTDGAEKTEPISVDMSCFVDDYNDVISSLSNDVSAISSKVEAISSDVSALSNAVQRASIVSALSALDEDPLSSLSISSMLSDIVQSVVAIRDALSTLRDMAK